jgi:hypothetical protein
MTVYLIMVVVAAMCLVVGLWLTLEKREIDGQ